MTSLNTFANESSGSRGGQGISGRTVLLLVDFQEGFLKPETESRHAVTTDIAAYPKARVSFEGLRLLRPLN